MTKQLIVACLVIGGIAGCFGGRKARPIELIELVPAADQLPEGVKPAPVSEDGALPFSIETNPFVSSDPAVIREVCRLPFLESGESGTVREVLFSCYKGEEEVGTFALRFSEEEYAVAMEETLSSKPRMTCLRRGTILAVVWHDGVPEAVLGEFVGHARQVLNMGAK